MTTPLERTASLTIGTIESVAPNEFKVQLDIEAPQSTALNAGSPVPFPRINTYVLVPGQGGAVVGQVTWIGIERSAFPKRKGLKDFGLIDLPFPLRRLAVTPIGTLKLRTDAKTGEERLELERGVSLFPSVGDPVSLPTAKQLKAVVEVSAEYGPLTIGRSALADNAAIRVHPDRLFGRHLAVLGNTGSGKSCSVAGLIRWTIEAVRANRSAAASSGDSHVANGKRRGSRFVILDPNGEYKDAFVDSGAVVHVLAPPPTTGTASPLVVPAWMWNAQEWAAILQASPGAQQPILLQAIRSLRGGTLATRDKLSVLANDLRNCSELLGAIASDLVQAVTDFSARSATVTCFNSIISTATSIANAAGDPSALQTSANALKAKADALSKTHSVKYTTAALGRGEVDDLQKSLDEAIKAFPPGTAAATISADHPRPFNAGLLPAMIRICALASPDGKALQHVAYLIERLEARLSDPRLADIVNPAVSPTMQQFLEDFLGKPNDDKDTIVIVDLSLVPSDITHLIVAVIARVLFEATQRYHKARREAFPTVLVLEEAHTFIQEGRDDPSQSPTPVQMCRRIFEKIAREGRKFGMGMILSSQRPSEISATVLSQCNTFLLHRLVNDEDQRLVRRLVPDSLSSLMSELPILPSRHAILLGHASPIPKMVVMKELPQEYCPRSSDPPLWDVWRGQAPREVDWAGLVKDWTDPSAASAEPPP